MTDGDRLHPAFGQLVEIGDSVPFRWRAGVRSLFRGIVGHQDPFGGDRVGDADQHRRRQACSGECPGVPVAGRFEDTPDVPGRQHRKGLCHRIVRNHVSPFAKSLLD